MPGSNRKAYFEINWATVRAHVQPGLADAIFVPYQVCILLSTVALQICHDLAPCYAVSQAGMLKSASLTTSLSKPPCTYDL